MSPCDTPVVRRMPVTVRSFYFTVMVVREDYAAGFSIYSREENGNGEEEHVQGKQQSEQITLTWAFTCSPLNMCR